MPRYHITILRTALMGLAALLAITTMAFAHGHATNKAPLSFGADQTIIDLNQIEWAPLELEGFAPGAEIAVLRGDLATAGEAIVKIPAGYTVPNHSHTSDETYVWLKGDFTYIAADGTARDLSGQTFISLPGQAPHALICGKEACVFYLRYSRPFDVKVHAMPDIKKQ
jgi:quercetin dioxygenase-like cupin family protein